MEPLCTNQEKGPQDPLLPSIGEIHHRLIFIRRPNFTDIQYKILWANTQICEVYDMSSTLAGQEPCLWSDGVPGADALSPSPPQSMQMPKMP